MGRSEVFQEALVLESFTHLGCGGQMMKTTTIGLYQCDKCSELLSFFGEENKITWMPEIHKMSKWIKDLDGDYVNIEKMECIYLKDVGKEYRMLWEVKTHVCLYILIHEMH